MGPGRDDRDGDAIKPAGHLARLRRDDQGQGLAEYGIVLALVAGMHRLEEYVNGFMMPSTTVLAGAAVVVVLLLAAGRRR